MKYSELLQDPEVQAALKLSFVDNVKSPIEDYVLPASMTAILRDEDMKNEILEQVATLEIDARKKSAEYQKVIADYDEKLAPFRALDRKVAAIRPVVDNYIRGNLAKGYDQIEDAVINTVALEAAERFGDHIPDEMKTPEKPAADPLDHLLEQASRTYIDPVPSVDEIVIRSIHDGGFAPLLK